MSNLIDRQAAIDALNEVVKDHSITDFDAIASILDLPPAQPEPHHDEWCTDCKEYDHENSCCPRWTKVIRQTRRELQDEFVMTAVDGTLWVTVDDVQKVGRVIVDEEKSKFCRQFYMDAQPEQRWIPCSEKLPTEEEKSYLVCTSEGEQCVCRWTDNRYGFGHGGKWGWHYLDLPQYSKGVAAYMPLPQAYREGDAK